MKRAITITLPSLTCAGLHIGVLERPANAEIKYRCMGSVMER